MVGFLVARSGLGGRWWACEEPAPTTAGGQWAVIALRRRRRPKNPRGSRTTDPARTGRLTSGTGMASVTVVLAEAVLLEVTESVAVVETDAVFVTVPAVVAVPVIVIVFDAPTARFVPVQVMVPALIAHPGVVVAAPVIPAGIGSVTVHDGAVFGPLFVTVTFQVMT